MNAKAAQKQTGTGMAARVRSLLATRWIPERYHKHLLGLMFLLGFVVCGIGSIHMGQDNNWDLRNYHYYNPHAFVHDRIGVDFAPAQRQTYLNPFPDMIFYFGCDNLPPKLFGFLMGGIHGLNFGLLNAICFCVLRRFSPNVRMALAFACSALGLYAPVFIGELGASQNDTLLSLFILASLLLIVRTLASGKSLSDPASRKAFVIASLLFGMGVGLKLTLMLYALATAAGFLVVEQTGRARRVALVVWSVAFLAGFLVTNGYWMARMWQEFGNPFFPFYNNIFKSAWAEPRSYADLAMVPGSLLEAIGRPFAFLHGNRYTNLQHNFRDARYAVIYVLLAALAVAWVYRRLRGRTRKTRGSVESLPADARFLLIFFVTAFVVWEANFSIIRYASVLEFIAPALIVILVGSLLKSDMLKGWVIVAALVFTAIIVRPIEGPRIEWEETFWDIELPELPDPDNTLIIIANPRPWAYLIAKFPPGVRGINLNSNLTRPDTPNEMSIQIRRLLRQHKGEIYLLSREAPSVFYDHDRKVMANYQYAVRADEGLPIKSRHSRPGLRLWLTKSWEELKREQESDKSQ